MECALNQTIELLLSQIYNIQCLEWSTVNNENDVEIS